MIFITNKYTKCYNSIIANAKARILVNRYTERHHIIPKSLGGDNSKENLVKLTAREHFICHWLLTKMLTGNEKHKMIYALSGMRRMAKKPVFYSTPITSRVYANLRGKIVVSEETREKQSKVRKGRSPSAESNLKRSVTLKGRVSPNKGKVGDLNPFFNKKHSEQSKKQSSETKKANFSSGKSVPWNKGKTGVQVPWNKGKKLT